jgi:hypothetical protein
LATLRVISPLDRSFLPGYGASVSGGLVNYLFKVRIEGWDVIPALKSAAGGRRRFCLVLVKPSHYDDEG